MSALRILPPGIGLGPCKETCQHTDCAESRQQVKELCAICHAEIGYDVDFYVAPLRHWKCAFLSGREKS